VGSLPCYLLRLVEGDGACHRVRDLVVGDEYHPLLGYLGMVIRFNESYLLNKTSKIKKNQIQSS
jgi:hypothetical protein